MSTKKYAVIGGDLRNLYLAEQLRQDYNRVEIYGFEKNEKSRQFKKISLEKAIDNADVLVCGLPFIDKEGCVNMPFGEKRLEALTFIEMIPDKALFVAGKLEDETSELLTSKGISHMDLLDREEMSILNAIPTAEGAIQIIMEELPVTLHSCRVLVLGFGNCGKAIAKLLAGMGAEVWAEARKHSDLAWIETYGYHPVHLNELERFVSDMNVIINTVPSLILNRNILNKVRTDCLIIDLASKPGGVDFEYSSKLGIKTIWALGVPGKVAPLTAGEIIKRAIYNFIGEREAQ